MFFRRFVPRNVLLSFEYILDILFDICIPNNNLNFLAILDLQTIVFRLKVFDQLFTINRHVS